MEGLHVENVPTVPLCALISGTFCINFVGLLVCILYATEVYEVNGFAVGCAFAGTYHFATKVGTFFDNLAKWH